MNSSENRRWISGAVLILLLLPVAASARGASDADWLFSTHHVLQIEIVMSQQHWDALRNQTRSEQQSPWGDGCFAEPVPSPFSYFPAQLNLDGKIIKNVAVRKKGMFGSLDDKRPSLKISFSKYKKGRRFEGLKKLTLNNSIQDRSLVRQCIGYEIFREAGIVAPRCGFAHVLVNGVSLGVYVNVESIDKGFVRRSLGDGSSCLEEGAATDFRPGWVRSFDHKFGPREKCRRDLETMVNLFLNSDSSLLRSIRKYFDLDSFFSFWAIEALLEDSDGYSSAANNFFVAKGADGLWCFIPWGIDEIMQESAEPCEPFCQYVRVYAIIPLRLWLIPKMRKMYISTLESLLRDNWDEDRLVARAEEMEKLIWPYLDKAQTLAMPEAMDRLISFICSRRLVLEQEMQMGPLAVQPFLASPPCNPIYSAGRGRQDVDIGKIAR